MAKSLSVYMVGNRKANVSFNAEYEEYVVSFFIDGVKQKDADYHTDCVDDANSTAAFWAKQGVLSGTNKG